MDAETNTQSPLLQFYLGTGTDARGRRIEEILAWDDEKLERVHDYIQWLFPLTERSAFNAQAPRLRPDEIESFRRNDALRRRLKQSLERMLRFYGLRLEQSRLEKIKVVPTSDFGRRSGRWLSPNNHNHLRLTRIMTSTATLGLIDEARALRAALLDLANRTPSAATRTTVEYWRRAIPDDDDDS